MNTITIVGLGPGPVAQLTKEAEQALLSVEKVFLRTSAHPVHGWLVEHGKHVVCFDRLYTLPWKAGGDIYEFMVSALLKETELRGSVTYALPGSPVFLEDTTMLLRQKAAAAGAQIRLVHGLSFIEVALAQLNHDCAEGLQVVLPWTHLESGRFTPKLALLVCRIGAQQLPEDDLKVDLTMQWLLRSYPANHPVTLVWTDGFPDYCTQTLQVELRDLVREHGKLKYHSASLDLEPVSASLYVPSLT